MNHYTEMTDEQLAMLYVGGDNHAFDILLHRNQSKLYSYIFFVVRNREVADDLFQDTFVRVITRLQDKDYQPTGKFSAWITRIAHNVIMDWYRLQARDTTIDVDSDNDVSRLQGDELVVAPIEAHFINEQVLCDVKQMMDMLPATQREVVFMRYFQNMSFKEIAVATGVSINTALGRMHYAVNNLRHLAQEKDMQLQAV